MNVTQIKDAIRYMSSSDKIEIYGWLDGELAGDLAAKIGSRRSVAIRQESNGRKRWTIQSEQPKAFDQ